MLGLIIGETDTDRTLNRLFEETIVLPANRGGYVLDAIMLACQRSGFTVVRAKDGENKKVLLRGDGQKVRAIIKGAKEASTELKKKFKRIGHTPSREGYTNLVLQTVLKNTACN